MVKVIAYLCWVSSLFLVTKWDSAELCFILTLSGLNVFISLAHFSHDHSGTGLPVVGGWGFDDFSEPQGHLLACPHTSKVQSLVRFCPGVAGLMLQDPSLQFESGFLYFHQVGSGHSDSSSLVWG